MDNALVTQSQGHHQMMAKVDIAGTVQRLLDRRTIIQQVMERAMREGVHYGKVLGVDKPTLLKPGAESLISTFQYDPRVDITKTDLGNGHIDVVAHCTLYHIVTGERQGDGYGSCSTYETKYRYRSEAQKEMKIPEEYWKTRDPQLLGGPQYSVRKKGSDYLIYRRYPVEDIADVWNTVIKMAKKRSLIDAVLTVTGASDVFTQDIEDADDLKSNTTEDSGPIMVEEFAFAIDKKETTGAYGKKMDYWNRCREIIDSGLAIEFMKKSSKGKEYKAYRFPEELLDLTKPLKKTAEPEPKPDPTMTANQTTTQQTVMHGGGTSESHDTLTKEQLAEIRLLIKAQDRDWKHDMEFYGVSTPALLTTEQATEYIALLKSAVFNPTEKEA